MPPRTVENKTTFGAELIEGMKLVLSHHRGDIDLEQVWPRPIDVKPFPEPANYPAKYFFSIGSRIKSWMYTRPRKRQP